MQAEYITKKAEQLLCALGSDPFEAVIQSGASLCYKDLGSLKGAYFGNMQKPAVVINETLDEPMKKIVCAHELGHHILHSGKLCSCSSVTDSSILEREANIFAAAYLIDSKKAVSLLTEGYTVSQTASMLETDENLLMFLLNSLNITDAPESTFLKNESHQNF